MSDESPKQSLCDIIANQIIKKVNNVSTSKAVPTLVTSSKDYKIVKVNRGNLNGQQMVLDYANDCVESNAGSRVIFTAEESSTGDIQIIPRYKGAEGIPINVNEATGILTALVNVILESCYTASIESINSVDESIAPTLLGAIGNISRELDLGGMTDRLNDNLDLDYSLSDLSSIVALDEDFDPENFDEGPQDDTTDTDDETDMNYRGIDEYQEEWDEIDSRSSTKCLSYTGWSLDADWVIDKNDIYKWEPKVLAISKRCGYQLPETPDDISIRLAEFTKILMDELCEVLDDVVDACIVSKLATMPASALYFAMCGNKGIQSAIRENGKRLDIFNSNIYYTEFRSMLRDNIMVILGYTHNFERGTLEEAEYQDIEELVETAIDKAVYTTVIAPLII